MKCCLPRRTILAGGLAFAVSPVQVTAETRYDRFRSAGLFADPTLFPIGVWLQNPSKATAWKECGINLYVGLWKGPTVEQLELLAAADMPAIAAQNQLALDTRYNKTVVGWLAQPDEPDNAQRIPGTKLHGSPISPIEMQRRYHQMRLKDPSRPVLLNLGQGVAWDGWHGRGWRTNHPEDYPHYAKAADIVSFDIYPVTSKYPDVAGRIELIGQGVQRLRSWTRDGQGVWAVVGASRIRNADRKPSPSELRAQAFMALVHGANGIVWFVHQFAPRFIAAAVLEDPETHAAMKQVNAEIQSLAPILNGGHPDPSVRLVGSASISFRALKYNDAVYVLSINNNSQPVQANLVLANHHRVIDLSTGSRLAAGADGHFTIDFLGYQPRIFKAE